MLARPLTTIHISTEKGFRGGERQVKLLTDGLVSRGHRCILACPPGSALYMERSQKAVDMPSNGGAFAESPDEAMDSDFRANRGKLLRVFPLKAVNEFDPMAVRR